MNLNHATLPRAPAWLRATLLLVMLGGCGGGVDSGGTGGAAVYASGPINGYGSVIVNGVRFDDSAPSIDIRDDDGTLRTKDDLKLGMVVEVRGSSITTDQYGDSNSTASSIAMSSELVGPVDAGSIVNNSPVETSLSVLGRRIDIQPTTVFTDNLAGGLATLAGLPAPQYIEVYGLYNPGSDRFTATRIELKSGQPAAYRVGGKVTGLTPTTLTIGSGPASLLINYTSASERPANLANDAVVRVRMNNAQVGGVWIANRLRSSLSSPGDGQESKVEGLIDNFVSETQFSVGGVAVTTSASTLFAPPGSQTTLRNGLRVEVEGKFANGMLVAREVEVELDSGDDFDFRGLLQVVNRSTHTLTIQGVSIDYSTVGDFGSGHSADDLAVGVNVRVRATLQGGTELKAYRIQFRN